MLKDKTVQNRKALSKTALLKQNIANRWHAYRDLHAHALFSSLGRLTRSPASLVMTLLVLSTSVALACVFYLIVQNVQQLTGSLASSNQISVFLKEDLKAGVIDRVRNEVASNANVESVQLITPEQALTEFKTHSGFGAAVDELEQNPLPAVLVVLPKNSLQDQSTTTAFIQQLQQYPEVDFAQSDMQWVKRLQAILELAQRCVWVMSLLFGLEVLLIVSNTIRLELQNRKDEVIIAKLVGATNAFIRRPFLYTGFWLGFLSSVIAWLVVTIIMLTLQQPVNQLSQLYASEFNIVFLGYADTFYLLLIGSLLGITGAWWELNRQLQHIKPE